MSILDESDTPLLAPVSPAHSIWMALWRVRSSLGETKSGFTTLAGTVLLAFLFRNSIGLAVQSGDTDR